MDRQPLTLLLLLLAPWALLNPAQASERDPLPAISIIIDDMGNSLKWGEEALAIPGPITYAFLPHTPHAARLASLANDMNKQVMVHIPMESSVRSAALGPGALTQDLSETRFKQTVQDNIHSVPYAVGVNNHMGSLLTRHPGAMGWLMESIGDLDGLYFVDSRTTTKSVGQLIAQEHGIPNVSRDVFLDNDRDAEAIQVQFLHLIRRAHERGYAIGIGHPYPITSRILQRLLAEPERLGVRLIPVSEMISLQGRRDIWPEHSSPSQRVAKNSKRLLSLTCCEEPASKSSPPD